MQIEICTDKNDLGRRAAAAGAAQIHAAIADRGSANVIVATGASQFEMLGELVKTPNIDWAKVNFFHLDEYVAMPMTHPASFRRYLKERLVDQLPQPPRAFHYLNAEGDAAAECRRLGDLIKQHPIDVAFIGIGENGHLAFNDPPADFQTEKAYIIVDLDDACRRQQFGEGWFPTLDAVPRQAISMSVKQILKSGHIICSVPDARKAEAVKNSVEKSISPNFPATILQQHAKCELFLDRASAALLKKS